MPGLRIILYDSSRAPNKQSRYSKRIRPEKWQDMMPYIITMFRDGLSRKVILRKLKADHNFHPSMGQLVHQMTEWHMKCYKVDDSNSSINNSALYSKSSGHVRVVRLAPDHLTTPLCRLLGVQSTGSKSPGNMWALRQYDGAVLLRLKSKREWNRFYLVPCEISSSKSKAHLRGLKQAMELSAAIWSLEFIVKEANKEKFGRSLCRTGDESEESSDYFAQRSSILTQQSEILCSDDWGERYTLLTIYNMIRLALGAAVFENCSEEVMLHTNAALVMLSRIRNEYLKYCSRPDHFMSLTAELGEAVSTFSKTLSPRSLIMPCLDESDPAIDKWAKQVKNTDLISLTVDFGS